MPQESFRVVRHDGGEMNGVPESLESHISEIPQHCLVAMLIGENIERIHVSPG